MSETDPDSRLYRKGPGKEARLCYLGPLMTENRHGSSVDAQVSEAAGAAERRVAAEMVERRGSRTRITPGGDKNYDTRVLNRLCREHNCTPHSAGRAHSSLDGRTTGQPACAISRRRSKLTEECNCWMKDSALFRKLRHRGLDRVQPMYVLGAVGYNIVRLCNRDAFWEPVET